MYNILAFDTSMGHCSIGVFNKDTGRSHSKHEAMERGHAEVLVPFIQDILAEAGMAFSDLDAMAVPLGPGAFTGLRIGLSTAQSLGLALDIPVVGISSFDALARPLDISNFGILIETKRSDFYVRAPGLDAAAMEAAAITERLGSQDIVWIGDGIARFQQTVSSPPGFTFQPGFERIQPEILIDMARDRLPLSGPQSLAPLYLRGADVSQPKAAPRQIA